MTDQDYTVDAFLGGALNLRQPRRGYRIAMDSILLAASIPAKAGDHVLEPGVGSGGASLCLARRVGDVRVSGFDIAADMVALADANAADNRLADRCDFWTGDVKALSGDGSVYDHIMINPPFLADGHAVPPPDVGKDRAHRDSRADLTAWIRYSIHMLKAKGSLTVVHRADRVDELVARMTSACGDIILCPLWPRAGSAAKRVIVQGRKGTGGRATLAPGLVLHAEAERYTAEARAILEKGAAFSLKGFA